MTINPKRVWKNRIEWLNAVVNLEKQMCRLSDFDDNLCVCLGHSEPELLIYDDFLLLVNELYIAGESIVLKRELNCVYFIYRGCKVKSIKEREIVFLKEMNCFQYK